MSEFSPLFFFLLTQNLPSFSSPPLSQCFKPGCPVSQLAKSGFYFPRYSSIPLFWASFPGTPSFPIGSPPFSLMRSPASARACPRPMGFFASVPLQYALFFYTRVLTFFSSFNFGDPAFSLRPPCSPVFFFLSLSPLSFKVGLTLQREVPIAMECPFFLLYLCWQHQLPPPTPPRRLAFFPEHTKKIMNYSACTYLCFC